MQTDVVCDDLVLLTLQYSTQWDSFAHVGSLFDADGDGKPAPSNFSDGCLAGFVAKRVDTASWCAARILTAKRVAPARAA